MREFAAELIGRRNRAALLLSPDLAGQRDYAARLAASLQAPHLDILSRFQQKESLLARVAMFSPDDLLALIAELRDHPLVVVTGIEFLLGVWLSQGEPKRVKQDFCYKLEVWQQQPAILIVTHEDPVFAAYQPQRFPGTRIILHTSQTLSLE
jgi:hypothetical protein